MKSLDRPMAYSAAILCGTLLWGGLAWPADTWQRWASPVVGVASLVALCVAVLGLARRP